MQKVARETATLDQLSRGRLILGIGLGANDYAFEPYGEVEPWREAGATWILTGFGPRPSADGVRDAIDAGPG